MRWGRTLVAFRPLLMPLFTNVLEGEFSEVQKLCGT
jgi:hypothetical protein